MKRDRIKTLLLAEALICALLALALWLFEGDAFSLAGFPGSAIGPGLSALAASGRFGFALAFTLYAAVILLPLYVLVHIGARRELLDRLLEHIGGGAVPAPCLAVAHFRAACGLGRAAAAAQAFRRRYAGALEALPRAAYPHGGVLRL